MQSNSTTNPSSRSSQHPPKGLVFSTTELGDSWQRCEQSGFWSSLNGLGLERPLPSQALALGSLIHYTFADWGTLYAARHQTNMMINSPELLEIFAGQQVEPDPVRIFEAHFARFRETTQTKYSTWRGAPMDDAEWQPYEDEVGELGAAMIANYQRVYGSPFPDDCTLLSPELTIVRPLPKIKPRQRQLYIEGTLDQLLIDSEGMLFPRDFKTYENSPSDYELDQNDQFMTYCWIIQEEFPDYKVAGFAYDGLWKRTGITDRMRRKDGSKRDDSDLFRREYLMYSAEKIRHQGQIIAFRAEKVASLLRRRARFGPHALDKHRGWSTCPSCSFADACNDLMDGDYGDWDGDAETEALQDYIPREKSPAWRVPLPELVVAV